MSSAFHYVFPVIRGIQASREYYVTMCPMRLIPRILLFDEQELRPELRSQRLLNKARVPAIANYIVKNPTEYVFSALTASIDADVEFTPVSDDLALYNIGHIRIPMSARMVINDGQHRRAAIEMALRTQPELGDETIACVLFVDTGLRRAQQMFADLNRYAVRPTQSLSILYDHRDHLSVLTRELVHRVVAFRGLTELDKSTISNRSRSLFTLSGVHRATCELLADQLNSSYEQRLALAELFWNRVDANIDAWEKVRSGHVSAVSLRREYIHAHTVALVAIGRAGRALLRHNPGGWQTALGGLRCVDWHRSNTQQWEGRATVGGRVSISRNNVSLLTNQVKHMLGIPLTDDEQMLETAFISSKASSEDKA
ncbi:MAG TPA: DNA sulfur modification protein DndB [Dissulfurispiraceae bacterium]|nr:DNA sulfur modification protein DndB [Dissulfurispiraceae bacterium]